MENRRKREGERTTYAKSKERKYAVEGGECERHYLYSCVSSAYDIMLTEGDFTGGVECLNGQEEITTSSSINVTSLHMHL